MEENREKKYQTVIIDTINGLQNNLYIDLLKNKGKANFDDWRDFAVDILDLADFLKRIPVDIVQITGKEGTGKTVGGSFLDPETTVWLNADDKPLSFFGARKAYPEDNSKKNYKVPRTYQDVKDAILQIHSKRISKLIVFMLAHVEDYKGEGDVIYQRMKTLGKMATKFNVDGISVHNYYTFVDPDEKDETKRYKLRTHSTGTNTGRSPQGYFTEDFIPNNYQIIVDKILADR